MDTGREGYCSEHHIKIMKVALAIAIIRQKPESVSALDYTLDLVQCFRGEELNWRGRARVLERELLRTRQELVQCRLQATTLTSQSPQAAYCYEEKGGCDVDKGVVKGHRVKGDCGRVVDTSEDADAMEGGLVVSKYREESKSIEDSKWLEAHVKFCTSVSRFQRVHSKLQSDIQETFKDTILDAIRGLKESLTSADPPYPQKLLSAIPCLTDFLSNPGLSTHDRAELSEAVVSLADTLISRKNESYTEQWLQSAVLVLSKVQVILTHVLRSLVSQLCVSAELFLGSLGGGALPSADQIDSAHGQVAMLEALLKKYDVSKNIESEVRYKMAAELEDSLLEVSWSYPLFMYGVWRVIAMLTK